MEWEGGIQNIMKTRAERKWVAISNVKKEYAKKREHSVVFMQNIKFEIMAEKGRDEKIGTKKIYARIGMGRGGWGLYGFRLPLC